MNEEHGFNEAQLRTIITAIGRHYGSFTEEKVIEVVNAMWYAHVIGSTVKLVLDGEPIGVGFENGELSFCGLDGGK